MLLHEFFPVYLIAEWNIGTGSAEHAEAVNHLSGVIPVAAAIHFRA
jgi:hypothetical protein